MAIPYSKKQAIRKHLKEVLGCYSVQFTTRRRCQYLRVEWWRKSDENAIKKFVYDNFKRAYVTSGGIADRTFRIFDDSSTVTTNQVAQVVQNHLTTKELEQKLSEVLLRADCKTRLSSINQYEWMAKHAVEFLAQNGYLK
ncbi:hypothetical protein [Caulobacter phage Cr30]|uniref:hypothetical protein n=1 Tax=Caulobacter phage Cr30 TaxID=1357714 RepID=UPI0004A9BA48|nr:hypothetical protein OZ74_gp023 [Caulobacter phage Cr30]AGS80908.1 hypothetical protein [Caulobacter phage Cr30]